MLMSRRKGHAANHIVRINGKRMDLKALEQVMMLHFPLKECAIIPKKIKKAVYRLCYLHRRRTLRSQERI
ncbi:hypothetical protein [Bacillus safensis]|uniref:hypothetical protein n=1 Tax=Bacillus safensis TaxID=561879 RepID=UPI001E3A7527|nr:hypothetical protein [Bacillus safensis]